MQRKTLWDFKSLDEFIIDDSFDMYGEGEYEFDEAARGTFCKALANWRQVEAQGKCTLEVRHPWKPYQYHTINVNWNFRDDSCQLLDSETLIGCILGMDVLVGDDGTWQIGKYICREKKNC